MKTIDTHLRDNIINSFNNLHFKNGYRAVIETLVDQGKCITTREHAQLFENDTNLLPYMASKPQNWEPTSNIIEIYFYLERYMEEVEYK